MNGGTGDRLPQPLLLDLDEYNTSSRPVVRLGGTFYEMNDRADLSFADQERYRRIIRRIAAVRADAGGEDGQLNAAQLALCDHCERELCRLALRDAPDAAIAGLSARQVNGLIEAFFTHLGEAVAEKATTVLPAPSGETTSPASLAPLRPQRASTRGSKRTSSTDTADR